MAMLIGTGAYYRGPHFFPVLSLGPLVEHVFDDPFYYSILKENPYVAAKSILC